MNTTSNAFNNPTFKLRTLNPLLAAAALCSFSGLASSAVISSPVTASAVTVAIIDGSSGRMGSANVAAQLNDDTYFNFTATVLSGSAVSNLSALSGYQVVVLGGSGHSNSEYSASTLAAVNAFMQSGGGVVTAGWYRYGAISAADQAAADAITPVVTGGSYDYAYSTMFTITNNLHDITAGVANFNVSGCCVEVASSLDVGATSLATAGGKTAVAFQDSVGRSVFLGALYTASPGSYGTAYLSTGAADRLLEQSVNWAAHGSASRDAELEVPEPGSLALVMAAFAGLAVARRRA